MFINEHCDISLLFITFLQVLEKRNFHVQNDIKFKGVLNLKPNENKEQKVLDE